MITAREARARVVSLTDSDYFWNSIVAKIYDAIGAELFHCIWYTPVRYDCVETDIAIIENLKNRLINLGYSCSLIVFTPTKEFANTRVKLYINWE